MHVHVRDLVFDDVLHADMLMLHGCQSSRRFVSSSITDRNPDHAGCAVPHAVPEHHGGGGEGGGERGGQQEAEVGGHGEDWGLETLERGDTDTRR